MHHRSNRTLLAVAGLCVAGVSLAAGCADRPEVQRSVARVQRAVGEGAQGALSQRPVTRLAIDESASLVQRAPGLGNLQPSPSPAPANEPAVSALPHTHQGAEGVAFDSDRNHQDVAVARTEQRLGVAWHDDSGVWFGATDAQGRGVASPVQVRALVSDEEGLSAPAVVAAGDAFGVAWVDAENGRVRFQVVGADGAARGPAAIVHDGLTDPRSVRLAYNGHEFGVAAQLREGVYFTRVDAQGHRLDVGQLVAEGEPVDALDSLRWDGRAYSVGFAVSNEGAIQHRDQRLAAPRAAALHARGAHRVTRWM